MFSKSEYNLKSAQMEIQFDFLKRDGTYIIKNRGGEKQTSFRIGHGTDMVLGKKGHINTEFVDGHVFNPPWHNGCCPRKQWYME